MDRHELNRMFEQLVPTAEQEKAVLDRLLQTERKVIPMKNLKKLSSIGIAAVVTLALVTCAAAVSGLFRVTPSTDYSESKDGIDYSVSAPKVEAESALAEKVNAAVQEKLDLHLAKAQQDWAAYKDAFFATGGTEEEWGDRKMDVTVDYEIKSQTDSRVSFVVSFTEGWVTSYEERSCYNLDLAGDRELTLRDLLGEDWVAVCNAAIQQQIDERTANGSAEFFAPEEGGFTTVDESTSFYIREDGKVVVCFPKYSIAAGSAGNLEFVV